VGDVGVGVGVDGDGVVVDPLSDEFVESTLFFLMSFPFWICSGVAGLLFVESVVVLSEVLVHPNKLPPKALT
jgi:hypothetical protein